VVVVVAGTILLANTAAVAAVKLVIEINWINLQECLAKDFQADDLHKIQLLAQIIIQERQEVAALLDQEVTAFLTDLKHMTGVGVTEDTV
jgi:hypothetical protein